jgi:ABC-type transport system involved in cytochrome c biogenesis permease component
VNYVADVAALTRKDLRVELRTRETLPAMLLFVVATLVIFHFALPTDTGDDAAYGLLWVALVFTACSTASSSLPVTAARSGSASHSPR